MTLNDYHLKLKSKYSKQLLMWCVMMSHFKYEHETWLAIYCTLRIEVGDLSLILLQVAVPRPVKVLHDVSSFEQGTVVNQVIHCWVDIRILCM